MGIDEHLEKENIIMNIRLINLELNTRGEVLNLKRNKTRGHKNTFIFLTKYSINIENPWHKINSLNIIHK